MSGRAAAPPRRRSPNEFGADLGGAPDERGGLAGAVYAGLKADRPNRRADLSRLGQALGEAGEAEDAASLATPERAAQAIGSFQRKRGLKVDGWAKPGGETDRTLANIRRRRKRLAEQNRPPESETIDDRLTVFLEQRAEEAQVQGDDLAALLATTAGRLFVRDHAGTLDPDAARPAVERALAPWREMRRLADKPLQDVDARLGATIMTKTDRTFSQRSSEELYPPKDGTACVSAGYIANEEKRLPGLQKLVEIRQQRVDDLKRQIDEAERDMSSALGSAGGLGRDIRACLKHRTRGRILACVGVQVISPTAGVTEALSRRNAAQEQLGAAEEVLADAIANYEELLEKIERLKFERARCLARKGAPTA